MCREVQSDRFAGECYGGNLGDNDVAVLLGAGTVEMTTVLTIAPLWAVTT